MKKDMQQTVLRKPDDHKKRLCLYLLLLFTAYCILPAASFADQMQSRAALVMNASTGTILYAKNPDLKCLPASTTKLMTAIVTMEHADLNDIVTISSKVAHVPPHKAGFKEGDRVMIEELLQAALIGSANDAAVALAEAVAGSEERFVELMNEKALAIGAKNTRFINANGLPGPGQYITVSDLAKIMDYALRYKKLKEIIGTRVTEVSTMDGNTKLIRNTNRLLWSEEDLVGGKTGYTSKARHCFVCAAERKSDTIIVALLGSPSRNSLWKETEFLIGKGFDVMGSKETPTVYLTKADYTVPDRLGKAGKRHGKSRIKKTNGKAAKKFAARKSSKHKKSRMYAKKNKKIKTFAKQKKSYRVAKKDELEKDKG
jgi:serine-type D-Ala-D-Ala carboxypeptidase (penicillin-binding protein 5/6)